MSELLHDKLPVGVRQSADGERYEFGVTVDGGFLAFSALSKNDFENDVAEFKAQAEEDKASKSSSKG
jgi:hypothetical protein